MRPAYASQSAAVVAWRGVSLLASVDDAESEALAEACVWRRYRPGERVFEHGTPSQEVYFVVEGAVDVVRYSSMGREITFARAGAGEAVGELGVIDGSPRSASVVAVEDSLIAVLPAERFIELLKRHGEITLHGSCRSSPRSCAAEAIA